MLSFSYEEFFVVSFINLHCTTCNLHTYVLSLLALEAYNSFFIGVVSCVVGKNCSSEHFKCLNYSINDLNVVK